MNTKPQMVALRVIGDSMGARHSVLIQVLSVHKVLLKGVNKDLLRNLELTT